MRYSINGDGEEAAAGSTSQPRFVVFASCAVHIMFRWCAFFFFFSSFFVCVLVAIDSAAEQQLLCLRPRVDLRGSQGFAKRQRNHLAAFTDYDVGGTGSSSTVVVQGGGNGAYLLPPSSEGENGGGTAGSVVGAVRQIGDHFGSEFRGVDVRRDVVAVGTPTGVAVLRVVDVDDVGDGDWLVPAATIDRDEGEGTRHYWRPTGTCTGWSVTTRRREEKEKEKEIQVDPPPN